MKLLRLAWHIVSMIVLVGLIVSLGIAVWRLSPPEPQQHGATQEHQDTTKYISVFCPVVSNNQETDADQQASTNQSRCIQPGTMADWAMVVVSFVAVFVAARTYRAVIEQSGATRNSVELAEKHFVILNNQWLDVSLVRVQAIRNPDSLDDSRAEWLVRFRIDNRTKLPVRVVRIEVFIEGDYTTAHIPRTISPDRNFRPKILATDVAQSTFNALSRSEQSGLASTAALRTSTRLRTRSASALDGADSYLSGN